MNFNSQLSDAVSRFWHTRARQAMKQGQRARESGKPGLPTNAVDTGRRSEATGGAQLNGFVEIICSHIKECGVPENCIFKGQPTLPGYFRATKNWDIVVVMEDSLLMAIELKSQIGPSFGNNFNNRIEEAIGSAADFLSAHQKGIFGKVQKPWLGWFMLLEDSPKSQSPVRSNEDHFKILPAFKGASYAKRYELFCKHLHEQGLYNMTCLMLSSEEGGLKGEYSEPDVEFGFEAFAASIESHIRNGIV